MKDFFQKILKIAVYCLLFIVNNKVNATHIVGGQLSYTCLGNNRFAITLVVRRDCINGDPEVYFDQPAEIGVFNGGPDYALAWRVGIDGKINIEFEKDDTIREKADFFCANPGQEVCVHQSVYRTVIYLPFNENGYIIAYQRCCRNMTISNIVSPLETGTTFAVRISKADLENCNSGPLFGPYPPIYTCVDRQFVFDHSAIDKDGDELVYSLCLPTIGRTKLDPKGIPTLPPYDSVILKPAYSINNLLNPNNTGIALKIDPKTGILTGVPNTIGQYLVGVCVTEYRNGVKMSTSTRDFEMNIVVCGIKPLSTFDVASDLCRGLDLTFKNNSKDATSYEWYFDFPNNLNLKSTLENPTFKFPSQGKYTVVLVAKNGSCVDTFRRFINISSGIKGDFKYTLSCLPDIKLNIQDMSTSGGTINSYLWNITGGAVNLTSTVKNPVFDIPNYGSYVVKLIVKDDNGCIDTLSRTLDLKGVEIDLIVNNYEICKGDSVHLVKNPDSRLIYTWSPTTGLNLKTPSDPIASPEVTTTYKVTVTDGNCSVE
ncbi:MAG: PKD domain-containing protein, partial [Saprospiraceae bacterium]